MCLMTSQRSPDMRERDRTSNLVFLLIKMRKFKDQGREITLMLAQEFNQHPTVDGTLNMISQTILERLIHTRVNRNN